MAGMRFMSIGAEGSPVQAATSDGQFQLLRHADSWELICVIEKDSFTMGRHDELTGRKLLVYCSHFPERARHACRKLHFEGDPAPLEYAIEAALRFEPKVPRKEKVTIELDIEMKGSDEDIVEYLRGKLGYANAIKKVHSIKVGKDG